MKPRLAVFAGLLLAFASSVAFNTDDDPLKAIISKLEKFRSQYPQEKVHLHLDKPFYAIGDDIWFKAYVVDAESHQLSGLSKILNVELVSEDDSIKQSLRLPLTVGVTWGDFKLSDSLQEGNYRIRAYTNYMRNFGEEYFFDKTVMVGNAISNNIVTAVNYQYETEGTAQKVNATINYADMDGGALTGKEVTYDVQLDLRNIARGKATTDGRGDIHISFLNNQPALQSGRVHTVLKLDKQRSVHKSFPIKSTSNETDVQFFPEGGNQVYGIRSKVAFKAVGADGLGRNITGYVSDGNGEKVSEFKSEHAGMGYFAFQPAAGQTYTATVKFPDGSEKKTVLPRAQAEGFVLGAVNSDSTNLLVKISASPAMVAAGGELTLIAQSNSVVKFVSKNKLNDAVFSASIPKSRFPTGILQLTLFNQQNQPVAERLVFISHNDLLNVTVNGPKTSGILKKVRMDMDVKDPSGKPVFGSFSVSVTDATKVPVDVNQETTIVNDLLLTSDIKGYIEQPNYYFEGTDEQKIRHLDNLMLTQGWRRFTWKNLMAGNFPPLIYQAEDGITISGRVTLNKKPVAGGKVMLISSQGTFFLIDTLTDAEGRFAFKNLVFPDSTRLVVQARTGKEKKFVQIALDRIPPQLVSKSKNAAAVEVNVNKQLTDYLKNSRNQFEDLRRLVDRNIMLSEVKIVERVEKTVKGSSNLAGRADMIIHGDELETCINILDCLQGRVPGLMIREGRPFLLRNAGKSMSGPAPMTIIVDGINTAADELEAINPTDVEGIEVLKGATTSIYGMRGGGGVLIITTKAPGSPRYYNTYTPGVISYMPKGYYAAREFYMPNYDDATINGRTPDLRTTIFWHPNLIVRSGKASFEFYNSEGKGAHRVTIEGIDGNGKLARYVSNYVVN